MYCNDGEVRIYDEKEALPYAWVYVAGKKRKLFFLEKWGPRLFGNIRTQKSLSVPIITRRTGRN